MWQDLWVAAALMLVLEGLMPFLSPKGFRRAIATVLSMDDKTLRTGGILCMVAGLVLLYLVR